MGYFDVSKPNPGWNRSALLERRQPLAARSRRFPSFAGFAEFVNVGFCLLPPARSSELHIGKACTSRKFSKAEIRLPAGIPGFPNYHQDWTQFTYVCRMAVRSADPLRINAILYLSLMELRIEQI